MTNQEHPVHRYLDAATSKSVLLCAECAAKRNPPLSRYEGVPSPCSDCKKKYEGVWSRWKPLLAVQTSSEDSPPPIDTLTGFVQDAKIAFESVRPVKGRPDIYLVTQGCRRVAFPCLRHDLVEETENLSRWQPVFESCKWFMPAFITGGELDRWYSLWGCSDVDRSAKFEELMNDLYTPRRQVMSVCSYHDLREFKRFRHTIMDALKAAQLGLYHASASTLISVVEAMLRAIESALGLVPVKNDVRTLIANVFNGVFARIKSCRSHGYHWIPAEYETLEFMARHDHLFLFLFLFREFLLLQLFAKTDDVDLNDGRILNRHAILHGITPPRGLVLDTMKLIGVLDGFARIIGFVTDQSFTLYGKLHEATDGQGGVVNQPGSSIDAVERVFDALRAVKEAPAWVAVDSRASQILEDIATNGTVIRRGSSASGSSQPSF